MLNFLRKDLTLILAVAAVAVSLSYAIGYVSEDRPETVERGTHFPAGREPKAQLTTQRVWKEPAFERAFAVDSAALKKPMIMEVDKAGSPYVLDWSDFKVKQFSLDGKLVKTFGDETGNDPFTNPTAFSVDANGNVLVVDPQQQRIKVFGSNGNTQTIRPQNSIYRLATSGDLLFTMTAAAGNNLFEIYDLNGRQLKTFGELLANQADDAIILDGYIVSDENQGFIYGGRYVGAISAYDTDGNQRYFMQTIDGVPQPNVLHVAGKRKIKPDTTVPVLGMSIVGNELYVLSGVRLDGQTGPGGQVLDVYDKREGKYLYSLKLPVVCKTAVVRSDHLYTLSKGEVAVWRFKQSV
jgi:hypothetical protein